MDGISSGLPSKRAVNVSDLTAILAAVSNTAESLRNAEFRQALLAASEQVPGDFRQRTEGWMTES